MTQRRRGERSASASTSEKDSGVDELDRLLELAVDGDSYIQLLRSQRKGEDFKYIDQFDPAEIRPYGIREFTLERCGGSGDGSFKARIRQRSTGEYGKSKVFTIEGEPKRYARGAGSGTGATQGASSASNAAATSGPESVALKVALAMGIPFASALGAFFAKKLLERPASDPFQVKLLELFADRGRRGEGVSALEIQRIALDAEKRGEDRGREFGELKAIVENGFDEDGSAPAANMAQVVDGAVKEFGKVLTRHMDLEERRMALRIPSRSSAATSSTPLDSKTAAMPLDTSDALVQLLGALPRPARLFLLSGAQAQEDPSAYVPIIVTKLSEESFDQMAAQIQRADFVDVLLAVVPQYQPYRDWFVQLVEQLREYFHAHAAGELDNADDVELTDAVEHELEPEAKTGEASA